MIGVHNQIWPSIRPQEPEHLTTEAMVILVTITVFQKFQRCQIIIWQNNGVKKLFYKIVWRLKQCCLKFSRKTHAPKIIDNFPKIIYKSHLK